MTWTTWPPRPDGNLGPVSRVLRALLALVLLATTGVIVWRVFAPAEVLATSSSPYPEPVGRSPGVVGELADVPLIVDGRLRVYASTRQVKADDRIDGKVVYTPRWSLRRWPQQLNGVVAAATTVVTRWSDGQVVALDTVTGEIRWRRPGPVAGDFTDAASVLFHPAGLHTSGSTVLVAGGGRVLALDIGTGAMRWAGDCRNESFTTRGGQLVCGDQAFDVTTGAGSSWAAGPYTALGCDPARSACRGVRDAAGRGWQTTGEAPVPATGLDEPGSTALLDLALTTTTDRVAAAEISSGAEQWEWTAPEPRILGARQATLLALSGNRDIVSLDALTGDVLAQVPLPADLEITNWQVASGYVTLAGPDKVVLVAI